MFPSSFEGQYRSAPNISYNRERSKNVQDLLKHTNEQREQREYQRRLQKSVLIIQRLYRQKFNRNLKRQKHSGDLLKRFQDILLKYNLNGLYNEILKDIIECSEHFNYQSKLSTVNINIFNDFIEFIRSGCLLDNACNIDQSNQDYNLLDNFSYYHWLQLGLLSRIIIRYVAGGSDQMNVHGSMRCIEQIYRLLEVSRLKEKRVVKFWVMVGGGGVLTFDYWHRAVCSMGAGASNRWSYLLGLMLTPVMHTLSHSGLQYDLMTSFIVSLTVAAVQYDSSGTGGVSYLNFVVSFLNSEDHGGLRSALINSAASAMTLYQKSSAPMLYVLLSLHHHSDQSPRAMEEHARLFVCIMRQIQYILPPSEISLDRAHSIDSDDDSDMDSDQNDDPIDPLDIHHHTETVPTQLLDAIRSRIHSDLMTRMLPRALAPYANYTNLPSPEPLLDSLGYLYPSCSKQHQTTIVISLLEHCSPITRLLWTNLLASPMLQAIEHAALHSLLQYPPQNLQTFFGKLICFANCLHWRLLSIQDLDLIKIDDNNYTQLIEFNASQLCQIVLKLRDIMYGLILLVYPLSNNRQQQQTLTHPLQSLLVRTFIQLQRVLQRLYNRDMRKGLSGKQGERIDWIKPNVLCGQSILRTICKHYTSLSRSSGGGGGGSVVPPWSSSSDQQLQQQHVACSLTQRSFGRQMSTTGGDDIMQVMTALEARQLAVVKEMPYIIALESRIFILRQIIISINQHNQPPGLHNSTPVKIRRDHAYEDAFSQLSSINQSLRIEFLDSFGLVEAGIDGGGLLKEFLSTVLHSACDPGTGLFVSTSNHKLYPNPQVETIYPDNWTQHYYLFGRMLALAVVKDLLIEVQLAPFFIHQLFCKHDELDIDNLQFLDIDLYRNLLSLKTMSPASIKALNLDFTITRHNYGSTCAVDLKPHGADTSVDELNIVEYIFLVADYKLRVQIQAQCRYICAGFDSVVPLDCLRLFDSKELGFILTGDEHSAAVDLQDLRNNTVYHNLAQFPDSDEVLAGFWAVLASMSHRDMRLFLQFVTSSPRAPLLGFSGLNPKFGIQLTPDIHRLPSASTCINLLKLPCYPSRDMIRDKLLTAIRSETGFHLS